MGIFSKYLIKEVTCCEIGHRWNPSCTKSGATIFYLTFRNSLRVYSFVYLVNILIN